MSEVEKTEQYFSLSISFLIRNKRTEFIESILPNGYVINSRNPRFFDSYNISKLGDGKICARIEVFWNNGPTYRFSTKIDSIEGDLFIIAMKQAHGVTESQIMTV